MVKIKLLIIFFIFSSLEMVEFRPLYEDIKYPIICYNLGPISQEISPIILPKKDINEFLYNLGMRESSNIYDTMNIWGYMGKYQFGEKTLRDLGYEISREEFLKDSLIQEQAMIDLLKHNKYVMRRWISKYEGKHVKGIKITESGILAAAHLGGPKSVKLFLKGKYDRMDKMGTSISDYMYKFSGYNLELENI